MNYYEKIVVLIILGCLIILNCPLIFHFISIRGGIIIFHYWFIFGLKFYYNYVFLHINKYSNEKKTKISKEFYNEVNDNISVKIRLLINLLYISLFVSLIVIMGLYNDIYMTKYQQIVYSINFICGTILYTTITEHTYYNKFSSYENIFLLDDDKFCVEKKDVI